MMSKVTTDNSMSEAEFHALPVGTEIAMEVKGARHIYIGRFRIVGPPVGLNKKRPCVEVFEYS